MEIRMTEEMLKKSFENAMTKLSDEEIASVIIFGGDLYNHGFWKGARFASGVAGVLGIALYYSLNKEKVNKFLETHFQGVVNRFKNKEEEAQ